MCVVGLMRVFVMLVLCVVYRGGVLFVSVYVLCRFVVLCCAVRVLCIVALSLVSTICVYWLCVVLCVLCDVCGG